MNGNSKRIKRDDIARAMTANSNNVNVVLHDVARWDEREREKEGKVNEKN